MREGLALGKKVADILAWLWSFCDKEFLVDIARMHAAPRPQNWTGLHHFS